MKFYLIIIISTSIVIQSLINGFVLNNSSAKENTDETHFPTYNDDSNDQLINLLLDINNKLDSQKKLLEQLSYNESTNSIDTPSNTRQENSDQPFTNNSLPDQTQYQLIENLYEHDMTLGRFLSNKDLNNLPKKERHEVLKEMVRKIDQNEISKSSFLPGFKEQP